MSYIITSGIPQPWMTSWASPRGPANYRRNCLWNCVGGGLCVAGAIFYHITVTGVSALSVLSAYCWVVHMWTGSSGHSGADQLSLYYSWQWPHFSDTDSNWNHSSCLQDWISQISRLCTTSGPSVICLVSNLPLPKQPWNLKLGTLCRRHRHFREPQPAEFFFDVTVRYAPSQTCPWILVTQRRAADSKGPFILCTCVYNAVWCHMAIHSICTAKIESCSISAAFLPYSTGEPHGSAFLPYDLYVLSEIRKSFSRNLIWNFQVPTLLDGAKILPKKYNSAQTMLYGTAWSCLVLHGHMRCTVRNRT